MTTTDSITRVPTLDRASNDIRPCASDIATFRTTEQLPQRVFVVWISLGLMAWAGTIGLVWLTIRLVAGIL